MNFPNSNWSAIYFSLNQKEFMFFIVLQFFWDNFSQKSKLKNLTDNFLRTRLFLSCETFFSFRYVKNCRSYGLSTKPPKIGFSFNYSSVRLTENCIRTISSYFDLFYMCAKFHACTIDSKSSFLPKNL